MAKYDLRCKSCGEITEEIRPMSLSMESGRCPKCGSKTERVFSGRPGIIVEGGTTKGG